MMKKMRLSKALALTISGLALLTGCGSADTDYSKYVTLGDYTSLEVEYTVEPVSEEQRNSAVEDYLLDDTDYQKKDGPIETGNQVEIYLTASADGEVLYDFSEDGYELIAGENEFGEEFDAMLIGKKEGDPISLTVTYDSEFADMMLAGKCVEYEGSIGCVTTVIKPELTDEFVQESFQANSVEEWLQSIDEELLAENELEAKQQLREGVVAELIKSSTISGYPKSLYQEQKKLLESEFEQYAQMFGCSVEEVYTLFAMDEQMFEEDCLDAVYRKMVLSLVQQRENIVLSDDECKAAYEAFAEENEYESVEELFEDYTEDAVKEAILEERTIDFLVENAKISER